MLVLTRVTLLVIMLLFAGLGILAPLLPHQRFERCTESAYASTAPPGVPRHLAPPREAGRLAGTNELRDVTGTFGPQIVANR